MKIRSCLLTRPSVARDPSVDRMAGWPPSRSWANMDWITLPGHRIVWADSPNHTIAYYPTRRLGIELCDPEVPTLGLAPNPVHHRHVRKRQYDQFISCFLRSPSRVYSWGGVCYILCQNRGMHAHLRSIPGALHVNIVSLVRSLSDTRHLHCIRSSYRCAVYD